MEVVLGVYPFGAPGGPSSLACACTRVTWLLDGAGVWSVREHVRGLKGIVGRRCSNA